MEIMLLPLSRDCFYRDSWLQEHAGTGLLASKNVSGGYTERKKKKNIKCLKFMWTATIRKAAALQAVTTVFVLWLKHCSNF